MYRLENLITIKNEASNHIIKIGSVCIENIVIPGTLGQRVGTVTTDFKTINSVILAPYISEGQTSENLTRQVFYGSYNDIIYEKKVKIYAAGNQTVRVTIIGTI